MSASGTSTSAVISSIATNLVLFGIFVGFFLLFRLKYKRVFSPKSSFDILPEEERPDEPHKDPFRWIIVLFRKPQSFYIEQAGLDGYFFLRFVWIFAMFFLCGVLIYTILLPVNATNGNGNQGFDQLSISNVKNHGRYYAHIFVGWFFYGAVIFVIYRELFFYNSLRSAALSSPKYAKKLSSRTILFQNVPDSLLDEKQFFKIANGVKRIYTVRNARPLVYKVAKLQGLVNMLENAETKLLTTAYKAKMKAEKKGTPIESDNIYDYVPENKRPRKRHNGLFHGKQDTIAYCKEQIPILDKEVKSLQKKYKTFTPKNSLFVEFENQYLAQLAFQSVSHHNPFRMYPAFTGIEPGDVYWANLRLFWWERIVRRFIAAVDVALVIIFWAVPVAFVGVVSNLTWLTNKLPWLRFIYNMNHKFLGIITGVLPTMLLTVLNMLLPIFLRYMAKVSGSPSAQQIELYTHDSYFAYLIVNSFIVVALSSSASSTVTQIIEKPTSAMSVLAKQLPVSSNFFISYIILQGLTITSGTLAQVIGFVIYYTFGWMLDNTLHKKWGRFSGLGSMLWGTTYPLYTTLVCIVLAYAIISPLIIVFASAAFFLLYVAMSYTLTYVMVPGTDSRGLHYPKSLLQIFTGIYIGQVCMIGIFAVGKGWGPIVLQAISIGVTVFAHIHLKQAFNHLVQVVPLDCMRPLDGYSETPSFSGETEYKSKVLDRKYRKGQVDEQDIKKDEKVQEKVAEALVKSDIEFTEGETINSIVPLLADRDFKKIESTNPIVRFFRPDVFLNYRHVKSILPASYNIEPPQDDNPKAYALPEQSAGLPGVWIPEDPMGLSKKEIEEHSSYINISDENGTLNKKGKPRFTGPPPN